MASHFVAQGELGVIKGLLRIPLQLEAESEPRVLREIIEMELIVDPGTILIRVEAERIVATTDFEQVGKGELSLG